MSTHAMLGCICDDGKVRAIWTSHDGSPDVVVPELYRVNSVKKFMRAWEEAAEHTNEDYRYGQCNFPFEWPVREERIGSNGDPMVFDTIEDMIKSQDFVCEYYLFKDGQWHIGIKWRYRSGYMYDPMTGYRTRKANEEYYEEGSWIPLKNMMPKKTVTTHGFNQKAYYKYLNKHEHDYFIYEYGLDSEEDIKELIDDADEF